MPAFRNDHAHEGTASIEQIGFGLGLIVPVITAAQLGSVPASQSGLAAGTLNTARQTGSVLGVAIFGSLTAEGLTHGLHVALLISAGIALAVISAVNSLGSTLSKKFASINASLK